MSKAEATIGINFCPSCGHKLEQAPLPEPKIILVEGSRSRQRYEAFERLRHKLVELAGRIDQMSEAEYDGWVDDLPSDEFIEFIGLGSVGLREIMYPEGEQG